MHFNNKDQTINKFLNIKDSICLKKEFRNTINYTIYNNYQVHGSRHDKIFDVKIEIFQVCDEVRILAKTS